MSSQQYDEARANLVRQLAAIAGEARADGITVAIEALLVEVLAIHRGAPPAGEED